MIGYWLFQLGEINGGCAGCSNLKNWFELCYRSSKLSKWLVSNWRRIFSAFNYCQLMHLCKSIDSRFDFINCFWGGILTIEWRLSLVNGAVNEEHRRRPLLTGTVSITLFRSFSLDFYIFFLFQMIFFLFLRWILSLWLSIPSISSVLLTFDLS